MGIGLYSHIYMIGDNLFSIVYTKARMTIDINVSI